MSYILDALRRADAERERGHVPGLHAQPLPAGPLPAEGARRLGWAGVAMAALLVLAALAGWLWGGGAQREAVPAAPVARPDGPATTPTPATLARGDAGTAPAGQQAASPLLAPSAPGTTDSTTTAARAPTLAQPATPPRLPPPEDPAPARSARSERRAGPATPAEGEGPAPRLSARARSEASQPRAGSDNGTPAEPAAPSAVPPTRRVLALDELPAEVRRSLPSLTVSGSIYSEDARSRFVMINGEAVREGGVVAPGLTLEQIELKSAVLRYKGYRYRLPL